MCKSLVPVVAIAAALLCSCSRQGPVQASGTERPEAPFVPVARVQSDNLSRGLELTAEFRPYQEVDVMAKVAGYIKEIRVDVGDRVKKDDLLATLEIPEQKDDLQRATASIDRANADVTHAQDE